MVSRMSIYPMGQLSFALILFPNLRVSNSHPQLSVNLRFFLMHNRLILWETAVIKTEIQSKIYSLYAQII